MEATDSTLSHAVARHVLRLGRSLPFARVLAPRRPVIVMYHGVPAGDPASLSDRVFEEHILFLKRHFEFVSPDDAERKRRPQEKLHILLTFDDGFRNNAEVVAPILRKYKVPAIFFVSSRHATPGKYLWFSHLRALERFFPGDAFSFRGDVFNMSLGERQRSMQRLRKILVNLTPHPAALYKAIEEELPHLEEFVSERDLANHYAGMSVDQVADVARDPLFSVGVHTIDHPFLTLCEPAEALHQIAGNRVWLETACGCRCDAIAYPGGDYSAELLSMCGKAGFTRGYAVSARRGRGSPLERPRIGMYAESTDVLGFKVQWGTLLRDMRIPVG